MKNKVSVNNNSYLEKFSSLQKTSGSLIETSKQECFSKIAKKLSNPNSSSKTYWSILKNLLTGKKFLAFLLFFMITNSLSTLEKKLSFLIPSLLISAH